MWYSYRYPVILSFENHCSVEQQKIVAQYLTNILGGIILISLLSLITVIVIRSDSISSNNTSSILLKP